MSTPDKKSWVPMRVRFVGDVSDVVQTFDARRRRRRPRRPRPPRGNYSP